MDYDLKITGGTIIDGTGAAGYRGDVGVRDGKIIAVGQIDGRGKEEIDADGAVVSPGFIDCHTHYDAQAMWDPMLSPSVYHGVTTVLAGNCGFTLAPFSGRKADADYLLAMLARVEGMPLTSLEAAVKPTWHSFGEYLDAIDGKLAINTGFMVGHSALRRYVMGDRAVGSQATPDEIQAMANLLRKSIAEGGTGFSTTISYSHSDHNGDPVPSRWATDEEILTLSAVVSEYPGTWMELLPATGGWGDRQYELSTAMSLAGQRMVNWNLMVVDARLQSIVEAQLKTGYYAAERGAKVYGLVPAVPIKNVINFRSGVQLDLLPGWNEFVHLPDHEKLAAMQDPAMRARLQESVEKNARSAGLPSDFGLMLIEHVRSARNKKWVGRLTRDYAAEVGLPPFDALFQLAVEEELQLSFSGPELGGDEASWSMRPDIWRDEYSLIGGSDAGAHLDAINTFALSTQLLGEGVRKRGLLPLEEAVWRITGRLADIFGLTGRGRIREGAVADLVVFDPDRIDCGPIVERHDLPQGETRLYAESLGVNHVIVSGVPVAAGNSPTGRLGGKVLRSGRDTQTVPLH
jgi:N-acyl-D-aspartate/D-glutamate deacylase